MSTPISPRRLAHPHELKSCPSTSPTHPGRSVALLAGAHAGTGRTCGCTGAAGTAPDSPSHTACAWYYAIRRGKGGTQPPHFPASWASGWPTHRTHCAGKMHTAIGRRHRDRSVDGCRDSACLVRLEQWSAPATGRSHTPSSWHRSKHCDCDPSHRSRSP